MEDEPHTGTCIKDEQGFIYHVQKNQLNKTICRCSEYKSSKCLVRAHMDLETKKMLVKGTHICR